MKKLIILLIFFILTLGGYYLFINIEKTEIKATNNPVATSTEINKIIKDKIEHIEITEGSTYGYLMATSGIAYASSTAIYEAAKPLYDLVKIRLGRIIELVYDKNTNNLKALKYKIDSEDELHVNNLNYYSTSTNASASSTSNIYDGWMAEIIPIPYEVRQKIAAGTVESSMYQAALDNNIDIQAIIELANAFQWTIDFAMDPRVGDAFKLIYEEKFLDGEYIMPGQIMAGKYVNDGKPFYVFYFEESEDNIGFFDEDGNSVQKMFLKAPVAFKYISSGYTTGNRVIMEYGLSGPHLAIDYAAAIGTPIRAVGNGTITFAGWNSGGYGYLTKIRHNGTYSTNYAHQSKIIVARGQKVSQGETIGYVGSTGYSTGPHLHYEMVKNGVKINPLKEILPPGKPIKEENKERFFASIGKWKEELDK